MGPDEIENEVVENQVDSDDAGSEKADPNKERRSIRDSLRDSFEEARKTEEKTDKVERKPRAPRAAKREEVVEEPGEVVEAKETVETEETPQASKAQGEAPAAWTKEAKETWAQLPPAVQAAVIKRETDMQKGVDALKTEYGELNQALSPHMDAIKRNGHTPAQAVTQLFAWFQALANKPDEAFPALMKSFGYAPKGEVAAAKVEEKEPPKATEGGEVPPALQKYIDDMRTEITSLKSELGQQVNTLATGFAQQSEAKTQEIIANWSKDKPHFDKVRSLMAQLIQSGAVPLKDGRVDLDGAYNMAIYANPEVREAVTTEAQAKREAERKAKAEAEKKAQELAALKAKEKRVSITSAAPGAEASKKAGPRGQSVRDALKAALQEARGE